MGKWVDDTVLDGALNIIKNNATTMYADSAEPSDRAAAISLSLADVAMASGDFTVADGGTDGRKVTVAAKSAVPVDVTGDAVYIAIISASVLLLKTTCTLQHLTQGNTVNFPAFTDTIRDPT
jgi:hypothetical protein